MVGRKLTARSECLYIFPNYVGDTLLPLSVNDDSSTGSYFQCLTLERLSVSDLADVQRKLYEVNTRWYNLGLELGLKAPILDRIGTKHRGDPSLCFSDTLKEWLKGVDPSPTWEAVVKALKSPTVRHHWLAEKIQAELLSQPPPFLSQTPLPHPLSTQPLSTLAQALPMPIGMYVLYIEMAFLANLLM